MYYIELTICCQLFLKIYIIIQLTMSMKENVFIFGSRSVSKEKHRHATHTVTSGSAVTAINDQADNR